MTSWWGAGILCVLVSPWHLHPCLQAQTSPSLLTAEELLGVMGDGAGGKRGQSLGKGWYPGQDRAVGHQLLLCLGDGHLHSGCGDGQ